jgi:hypothetical protein
MICYLRVFCLFGLILLEVSCQNAEDEEIFL